MDQDTGDSFTLSPLGAWATQVHELYLSMQQAGFTKTEALTMITGMSTGLAYSAVNLDED